MVSLFKDASVQMCFSRLIHVFHTILLLFWRLVIFFWEMRAKLWVVSLEKNMTSVV